MKGATPAGHLVLIGMMGSGKTTVGRIAAERLGRRFVDVDAAIEDREGRSVRAIFTDSGETTFRDIEAGVVADLLAAPEPSVIAAGGGVVLRAENRSALRAAGARVVWLCASPESLADRVRGGTTRPLLDNDPVTTLTRLSSEREALYRETAHAIVRTDHRSISEVVEAVLR